MKDSEGRIFSSKREIKKRSKMDEKEYDEMMGHTITAVRRLIAHKIKNLRMGYGPIYYDKKIVIKTLLDLGRVLKIIQKDRSRIQRLMENAKNN